ncbi:F-box/LRR-repeat protein 6 [Frankliniella fusca]|uniref:F-box/LRR-repeat protein 6 n=1 Tax=Frankliniella fusca TaxID=407009 RepID=A0AAE1I123_9NEOP|nr:F-box/LRR-repeat protein 6 [Frankliniella fusca]
MLGYMSFFTQVKRLRLLHWNLFHHSIQLYFGKICCRLNPRIFSNFSLGLVTTLPFQCVLHNQQGAVLGRMKFSLGELDIVGLPNLR